MDWPVCYSVALLGAAGTAHMQGAPCAVSLWRSSGWTEEQQGLGTLSHVCMMLGVTSLHQSFEPASSLQKLLLVIVLWQSSWVRPKALYCREISPVTHRSVSPCSVLEAADAYMCPAGCTEGERC